MVHVYSSGRQRPLGVSKNDNVLWTGWLRDDENAQPIVVLGADEVFGGRALHYLLLGKMGTAGHYPAWSWKWTLDTLSDYLGNILKKRQLPLDDTPLASGAAWAAARALLRQGRVDHEPILLSDLEVRLNQVHSSRFIKAPYSDRHSDLVPLRNIVNRLREEGRLNFESPWSRPDRDSSGGLIWNLYSPEQIFRHTLEVYTAALHGYEALVRRWFPALAPRFRRAVILPAVLRGIVSPPTEGEGHSGAPGITWYLEPLPYGNASIVSLRQGSEDEMNQLFWDDSNYSYLSTQLRILRTEAAAWISPIKSSSVVANFGDDPATELVFEWLWRDLAEISWVKGLNAIYY